MNILSNNCIGGFVYRDILHTQYRNPFIWTGIDTNALFVDFIDNYDNINFNKIMLESSNGSFNGELSLVIDGRYKWHNCHIKFLHTATTPIYVTNDYGNDVYTNEPWKYIVNKYMSRLKRMQSERDTVVIAYNIIGDDAEKLAQTVTRRHIKTLMFSPTYNTNNDYITAVKYCHPGVRWEIPIINSYGDLIRNFIHEAI